MPGITVTLGADNAALTKGLSNAKAMIANFKKDASLSQILQSDKKVERNLAGIVSDLSRVSTAADAAGVALGRLPEIFKGSLLVGATAAVAAQVISIGVEGQKTFSALAEGARNVSTDLSKAIRTGGVGDLTAGIDRAKQKMAELHAATEKEGEAVHSVAMFFMQGLGGSTEAQRLREISLSMKSLRVDVAHAERQILAIGKEDLKVISLRAEGREEEADELQRQLTLAREIKKVEESGLTADSKRERKAQLMEANELLEKLLRRKMIEKSIDQSQENIAAPGLGTPVEQSGQAVVDELARRGKIGEAIGEAKRQAQEEVDATKERLRGEAKEMREEKRLIEAQRTAAGIDKRTNDLLSGPAARAEAREAEQRRERAERRAIEEEVQKKDAAHRKFDTRGIDKDAYRDRLKKDLEKAREDPVIKKLEEINQKLKALEKLGVG